MKCELPNIIDVKLLRQYGILGESREACDYDDRRPWEKSFHYRVHLDKTVSGNPYLQEFVQQIRGKVILCPNYIEYKSGMETENDVQFKKQIYSFDGYDYKFFSKANKKIGIKQKVKFIKNFPNNIMYNTLIVSGDTGVGKSYLAQCLREQESQKGRNISFIKWLELVDKFRSIESIDSLLDSDILIIDDFGEEEKKESGWTEEKLKALLDSFQQNHRPKKLAITTNKEIDFLIQKYTEKLMGRILKDSQEVEIFGPNYNLKDYE